MKLNHFLLGGVASWWLISGHAFAQSDLIFRSPFEVFPILGQDASQSEVVRSSFQVVKAMPPLVDEAIKTPDVPTADSDEQPLTRDPVKKSDNSPDKKDNPKEKDREAKKADEKPKEKKWYDKYTIRGYAQVRYNETLHLEDDSAPPQHVGDRSVSENQSFFLRRARLIISADVSEHMSVYLQPDFATSPNGAVDSIYFAQVRDWYADCYVDKTKVHRFRFGQSKLPYGWENMQSSGNRIPLDRSDSLNTASKNERDLGVFYYWTPEPAQEFFTAVNEKGLKGSGNYGVFGLGIYNGQGGSLAEQNDNMHVVSRFVLPVEFCGGQYAETAIQAYVGRYSVLGSPIRPLGFGPSSIPLGTIERGNQRGILDERVGWTGVWYPQPIGFQSEWNIGRGPALNASQNNVEERSLYGGYVMTILRYETCDRGNFFPFARLNYYKGGYKTERNTPYALIRDWEAGIEWQLNKQMEFVGMYTHADRTNTTAINEPGIVSYGQFVGGLLRFQFQFNY